MLIGKVLEQTPEIPAYENMANRLADRIRNIWLEHKKAGDDRWEENIFEDPEGIVFLSVESLHNLKGIDYIFRWWGNEDDQGLAGDLQVLWKVLCSGKMKIYKTTIRFGDRDFPCGNFEKESQNRTFMRKEFCNAFKIWLDLFAAEGI